MFSSYSGVRCDYSSSNNYLLLSRDHVRAVLVHAVDELLHLRGVLLAAQAGTEVRNQTLWSKILEHLSHSLVNLLQACRAVANVVAVQQPRIEVALHRARFNAARSSVRRERLARTTPLARAVERHDVVTSLLQRDVRVRRVAGEAQERHARTCRANALCNLAAARHGESLEELRRDVLAHRLEHLHHIRAGVDLRDAVLDNPVRQCRQQHAALGGMFREPAHAVFGVLLRRSSNHVEQQRIRRGGEADERHSAVFVGDGLLDEPHALNDVA
mmetsp:Transcript_13057/g.29773  ORF Transcript_13057/g.29773 Transcript_13057/m.29773 type:complete len:272 (+) Transcript_13057:396-1211(+)